MPLITRLDGVENEKIVLPLSFLQGINVSGILSAGLWLENSEQAGILPEGNGILLALFLRDGPLISLGFDAHPISWLPDILPKGLKSIFL